MCRKFGEVQPFGFGDMQAARQTDTLITIHPSRKRRNDGVIQLAEPPLSVQCLEYPSMRLTQLMSILPLISQLWVERRHNNVVVWLYLSSHLLYQLRSFHHCTSRQRR